MGELSPIHWLVVFVIMVMLFGGRRIPELMRGLGEGVKNFKEGMREEPPRTTQTSNTSPPNSATPATTPAAENKLPQ